MRQTPVILVLAMLGCTLAEERVFPASFFIAAGVVAVTIGAAQKVLATHDSRVRAHQDEEYLGDRGQATHWCNLGPIPLCQ